MRYNTPPYKSKPLFWESIKTKNRFPYLEYINHGYGGEKYGRKDLPKEGYPYTIIYENDLYK